MGFNEKLKPKRVTYEIGTSDFGKGYFYASSKDHARKQYEKKYKRTSAPGISYISEYDSKRRRDLI
jgi:hypothetical protein